MSHPEFIAMKIEEKMLRNGVVRPRQQQFIPNPKPKTDQIA